MNQLTIPLDTYRVSEVESKRRTQRHVSKCLIGCTLGIVYFSDVIEIVPPMSLLVQIRNVRSRKALPEQ